MAKLYFYGIIALIVIFVGIPALQSIGDGYSKDMTNMMDVDRMMNMNINPDAAPLETFVRMTPNGSKALVTEVDSFFDGVMTFFMILLVIAGVIGFLYIRHKMKEDEERERRLQSLRSSRYSSSYRGGSYYR
ncbi:hypothetical protein [Paenibacillus validus]|uniref:hypothetical protein n=1 Tax=Paenibacillus validus TaxID=44253 RepID=UPI003D29FFA0